jgi:hypothetical protein
MGKNRSSGDFLYQQSMLGMHNMGGGGVGGYPQMIQTRSSVEREDYMHERMLSEQRQRLYNQELTRNAENELQEQELVEADEEIYYLLT